MYFQILISESLHNRRINSIRDEAHQWWRRANSAQRSIKTSVHLWGRCVRNTDGAGTPVTWIRIHSRPLKASEKHTPTAGNIRNIRHLRMRGDKPVSSTGRTNGGAERRASYPGDQRVKHANRATKIWVKVAMGIAYFLCVSIAAFFLAIYYVFFWTPDGHNNATKTETASPDSIICHWKKLLQLFLMHCNPSQHSTLISANDLLLLWLLI